ncbi:hypothetical protein CDO35_11160 [Pseudomonas sediminis]|uniref:Uncharacterized protein n=1 Tax=Pseudomonas sediminis TaxID=1691904 RepID=A0A2G5FLM7_9PSED|nr:hypothetical protein CDO35_11160 [Pseudomonas sediminis]
MVTLPGRHNAPRADSIQLEKMSCSIDKSVLQKHFFATGGAVFSKEYASVLAEIKDAITRIGC